MKYIRIILLLATFLMAGCTHEDYRNCPRKFNVALNFSLQDKNGNEVFRDNVDKTDMFIFDDRGELYQWHRLDKQALTQFQGIKLSLKPGSYTIATWGNANNRMSMCDVEQLHTCEDGYLVYMSSECGDPLYYAPQSNTRANGSSASLYSITVPDNQTPVEEVMSFDYAHKKLDIYVEGFFDNGQKPVIEIEGHKRGYDFYMNDLDGPTVRFFQTAWELQTPEGSMDYSSFYTSRIKEDNSIIINIKKQDGTAVHSVRLNDVIESFENFDLETEVVIPIKFEFLSAGVEITLPSWGGKPSKPEID